MLNKNLVTGFRIFFLLFSVVFSLQAKQEFVLFTQPKTGTYLVGPLLEKMTGRAFHFACYRDFTSFPRPARTEEELLHYLTLPDFVPIYMHHLAVKDREFLHALDRTRRFQSFFVGHTPYSEQLDQILQKRDCVVFFILRDPRDTIVSGARFYGSSNQCIFPMDWYQSLPFDEQIMYMMTGTNWFNNMRWILTAFKGWLDSPNCCVVDYEKLLGAEGVDAQLQQLRNMARRLNLFLSDDVLWGYFHSVFGRGPTYSGKRVSWRDLYTEEHKQVCKECIGDLLIELGYEKDMNW